ncbi:MAG: ABC-2 transporter permease [Acetatifactor sp.]|nr:ABC-2 transporter permease [Acetatifactor sp.]
MEIVVSNKASRPLYEQIASLIKAAIMSGELKAGEAIPSVRALAKCGAAAFDTLDKSEIIAYRREDYQFKVLLITLANADEQWKWGKYAVALPASKRQIVNSRYIFAGIAAIIGFCISFIVNTISYFCFPAYQFGFYLFVSAASFCVVLLFLSFILPSDYWLGVNAGFAAMFILIILLVVLGLWSRMTDNAIMGFVTDNFDSSMMIGFAGTVVIFALSYILSVTLFKRKYA